MLRQTEDNDSFRDGGDATSWRLSLATLMGGALVQPTTPHDDGSSRASLLLDGRRVGIWRYGCDGGWPMVWCHGGLSCGKDAILLHNAARRCGADIIAIDRPGIGGSDRWPVASIAHWPHVVAEVADRLGVGRFAVAGWSGGGPYALATAAALPHRVRAVATVAGIAPIERVRHVMELGLWADVLLIAAARWCPVAAQQLLRWGRRAPKRFLIRQLSAAPGGHQVAALQQVVEWLVAANAEAFRTTVAGTADEYGRLSRWWGFDLSDVRQPVTVWQGELDTWVPMSHAHRIADAVASSALRLVPSAGHLLPPVIAQQLLDDLAP